MGTCLVSVACDAASLPVYAVANPAVITLELPTPADFAAALEEPRRNAVVVGPGNGVSAETCARAEARSEEHTSELQSLMRISYAVFCLKKKNKSQRTSCIIQFN